MARPEGPILIVGAGIGGLTAAIALLRQGLEVRVFERAPAFGDVGAGISLGRTAVRGLRSIGLGEALDEAGDRPAPSAALHYRTGEVLGGVYTSRNWVDEDSSEKRQLHRADLSALLKAAVEARACDAISTGMTFTRFEQDADGVTAHLSDGESVRGAALIGCDGIRSEVRAQLAADPPPVFAGRVAYRFLVPIELARPYMVDTLGGIFVGPGQSLQRYTVRHRQLLNCVAFVHGSDWRGEGWSQRVDTDELVALFDGWHPDVIGLARVAPCEGTAKWALYDRDPLPAWTDGRVTLLGDAAHPVLPFLGFGAALCIEDAVVLGRAFSQVGDVREALALYEKTRIGRATDIQLDSRHQGRILQEGPESTLAPRISQRERTQYDPAVVSLRL